MARSKTAKPYHHGDLRTALVDAGRKLLEEKGLRGKVWLRDSSDRLSRILSRRIQVPKALAMSWIGHGFGAAASARGFPVNDGFAGFSDFSETRDYATDFARYLAAPGAAHLVMCHPGRVDDALMRLDPVTRSREKELAFLLSPRFAACLAGYGAELWQMTRVLHN